MGSIATISELVEAPLGEGGNDSPPEPEAIANARLIAAAPDLLKALRPFADFLDVFETLGGTSPKSGEVYTISTRAGERSITVEAMQAARDAIAKATGAKS